MCLVSFACGAQEIVPIVEGSSDGMTAGVGLSFGGPSQAEIAALNDKLDRVQSLLAGREPAQEKEGWFFPNSPKLRKTIIALGAAAGAAGVGYVGNRAEWWRVDELGGVPSSSSSSGKSGNSSQAIPTQAQHDNGLMSNINLNGDGNRVEIIYGGGSGE